MMKLNKKPTSKKFTALLLALVLVAAAGIGGTWAWLKYTTDTVTNTFDGVIFDLELEETFTDGGTEKTDVYVENTGDVDMYVRMQLIPQVIKTVTVGSGVGEETTTSIVAAPILYEDSATGGMLEYAITLDDFEITGWNTTSEIESQAGKWVTNDTTDYCYYTDIVEEDDTVAIFKKAVVDADVQAVLDAAGSTTIEDGVTTTVTYSAVLVVMTDGIQTNVVTDYWDVTLSSGEIDEIGGKEVAAITDADTTDLVEFD